MADFLPQIGIKPVTGAAFSYARYKIKLGFFFELDKLLSDYIIKPAKRWKDYQLIAGDGSSINLPSSPQIKKHFGIYQTSKGGINTCLARTFIFYDVLSNFVLDSIISPTFIGELTLMMPLLKNLPSENTLVLLDRGFGFFSTCKQLINNKQGYCIRLSVGQSSFSKKAMLNPESDFITMWTPGYNERETCKRHGIDSSPIKVRVTKVLLKSGEIELLVSSIYDTKTVTAQDMEALYALRWGIEEGFKKLKPKMKLEQFGCKKHEGVYQEFYAHIFMMNLVAIIGTGAQEAIKQKTAGRKNEYKYNWQNAFLFVRAKIGRLFTTRDFVDLFEELIHQVRDSLVMIRPGRAFVRRLRQCSKSTYMQCYK